MEEKTLQTVVRAYRKQTGLSVRKFAEALTEKMVNHNLSGNTINTWENKQNHFPDLSFFFNCFTTYTDWRMYFAVDALKAIMPHVFDSGMVTFHLPKTSKSE